MTGEEPKYEVFLLTQMYHVLFFYKQLRVLIISIQMIFFSAAKTLIQRGISLFIFLLTCLKGIFW